MAISLTIIKLNEEHALSINSPMIEPSSQAYQLSSTIPPPP